jgi:hypothetical protein
MTDATQTALTVGVPTLAVLIGALLNNSRLSDLRALIDSNHANARGGIVDLRQSITDLKDLMNARFAEQKADLLRVEQVMDTRLKHLEESR